MKHDNLYLHQVFINALVTQILSPASPSMRFLHRAVAVKQCRTQHSEPILHNEAHRPHESTRQRACAAQLECLCKFLSTLGFPKIPTYKFRYIAGCSEFGAI